MKALRIAIAVFVLLMVAGLINGAYLSAQCRQWSVRLAHADEATEQGDWNSAQREMDALKKSWQGAQSYLHITLQHEEINKADTLLHQCALYAETQDGSAFSDAAVQLTLQFDRLAEMERLSIKNVL